MSGWCCLVLGRSAQAARAANAAGGQRDSGSAAACHRMSARSMSVSEWLVMSCAEKERQSCQGWKAAGEEFESASTAGCHRMSVCSMAQPLWARMQAGPELGSRTAPQGWYAARASLCAGDAQGTQQPAASELGQQKHGGQPVLAVVVTLVTGVTQRPTCLTPRMSSTAYHA